MQLGRSLRIARADRGLSLGEIAERAGLSKSILSRIERGDGNPSIETLWRISHALDVPLGALLEPNEQPRVRTIASRSGAPLRGHSGMAAWLIHADGRGHRTELFDIELPPDGNQRAEPHLPGTEEVVVCVAGSASVGPLGEEVDLAPGDSAWFVSDGLHGYNAGPDGARLVNLILLPTSADRGNEGAA